MTLPIKTFVNGKGTSFFKALGHPKIIDKLQEFSRKLSQMEGLTIYDPLGYVEDFLGIAQFCELPGQYEKSGYAEDYSALTYACKVPPIYVQAVEKMDHTIWGRRTRLISEITKDKPKALLILSFEPQRLIQNIQHLIPEGCEVLTLESLKLPEDFIGDKKDYLVGNNWATNFAFMREEGGWHTRAASANYWIKYGAKDVKIWCCLMDSKGKVLAEWTEDTKNSISPLVFDSAEIKKRFSLPDFTGQLFIHHIGAKGHDIVKYALDTYHDDGIGISATHDANAWPPEFYAGLPAPRENETVILWLQNSHPIMIPAHCIALRVMGEEKWTTLPQEFAPFETQEIDVSKIMPHVKWPQQIEIKAANYFVRPRYEVINASGYRCIAHVNVERNNLKSDPNVKKHRDVLGKAYIYPAPILPQKIYKTTLLQTPMSTELQNFPIKALFYSKDGVLVGEHKFGNLPRNHSHAIEIDAYVTLPTEYGHVELVYDFDAGDEADGWLHGLSRYETKLGGFQAETSFGSHIFNTAITYKSEPQSYKGPPPGVTTNIFLRVGPSDVETFCHLIYPSSTMNWTSASDTHLTLHNDEGEIVAKAHIAIPQSGSRLWRVSELFSEVDRKKAEGGYVIIDDRTCRLFGYHGLIRNNGAFSLDHMFGF
ncbi:hypothetical protein Bealeia1_01356 [Candidatus Bealeia paramacronuclearis]|uniref:Uncharacterized protein n=1 Tax=Candidatus Bealeia paramacronuclearis TaxID=1921001 RepID=A0ABZ2C3Y0_9PROT|nr:hypothetical protein [Candidatus Bealeia paramacronuclearis]